MPDGSVEAVMQGDDDAVKQLLGFCRLYLGHVESYSCDDIEEDADLSGFSVQY
jgi:acylphosphatase